MKLAALLGALLLAAPAFADSGQIEPVAAKIYCLNHGSDCSGGTKARISYEGSMRYLVGKVNRVVNRHIRPSSERVDIWSAGVAYGDCEDYALTKRKELIHAGIPSGALAIAVGYLPSGEAHAVLVVRTSSGDLALDNLHDKIVPLRKVPGRWIAMSGRNLGEWAALN